MPVQSLRNAPTRAPHRERPRHPRLGSVALLLVALLVTTAWSGCLGIERTEWAFRTTQLANLQTDGLTGAGITVGIVDTGIDPTHPSLDHVQIVAWRDYIGQSSTPYDDTGHGTHVAGIIAARGGTSDFFSGADVDGVAPSVSLIVIKACGQDECSADAVERGIAFAANEGADIITLSLGGQQALISLGPDAERAVTNAAQRGVYVVAAAGNAGTDHGDVESPASTNLAIAVGAVDEALRVPSFSSRGNQQTNDGTSIGGAPPLGGRPDPHKKPEIVAPGVDILSAWVEGKYATATGTSQAAPFVAGAIALLLEAHPEWKRTGSRGGGSDAVVTMKEVLTESAKPIEGQRRPHDPAAGYGLLQAQAALARLAAR